VDGPDFDAWSRDAREGMIPVLLAGLALLWGALGWALWVAVLVLGLLGIVLLVVGATVTFAAPDPGQPDR
jgi:uncharacterized membrane protein YjdF